MCFRASDIRAHGPAAEFADVERLDTEL
ncbi:hypothetical protein SMD44_08967 [Streptomyces alboflavus]|uniref:Uncharacterized protein n=1 Tax=Streptomyces alboflavus TaxID=67267 RepID=A0A1Z1WSQ9_9ACTN|nr:hypothetical protein SMD44_08967 [Streptomyces alboflavus]